MKVNETLSFQTRNYFAEQFRSNICFNERTIIANHSLYWYVFSKFTAPYNQTKNA